MKRIHRGYEIREARDDELLQLGAIGAYVYAGSFGDGPDNMVATSQRPEWTLCAFDGSAMVASSSVVPFHVRANGTEVAMGGVTAVGTLPEHRRRGLVRALLTTMVERMRERQQPLSGLWASQGAIYQRFGYAQSSANCSYSIDSVDVRFADGDEGVGTVRREDPKAVFSELREIYARFTERRMGYLRRSSVLWHNNALADRSEDGPAHVAICRDRQGVATGYVVYTLRSSRVDHVARAQEIRIRDLAWLNADAWRSLFAFLGSHDLVGRIAWDTAPVDDPGPELLLEPRMLHRRTLEGHWLRVIDAEAALTQRGYCGAGRLTLEVHGDELGPWNNGCWNLEAEGCEVRVTPGETPDLRLSIKALSSLYSGYRSARWLANAGLLEGSDDAVSTADRVFATWHAPHAPDHY